MKISEKTLEITDFSKIYQFFQIFLTLSMSGKYLPIFEKITNFTKKFQYLYNLPIFFKFTDKKKLFFEKISVFFYQKITNFAKFTDF